MTAEGKLYTALHLGKDYYYLPTKEKWTLNMKEISLGDIYFDNILIQMQLGKPNYPNMEEFPELPEPKSKTIKISLG